MSTREPDEESTPVVPTTAMTPEPRQRQVRRGPSRLLAGVLIAGAIILVGIVGWYELQSHPFGGPGKPVTVEIVRGQSYQGASSIFAKAGVISDDTAYGFYSMLHGRPTLLPGFYTAPKNSTFGYLHHLLTLGPNTTALKVPPGFTLQEVAGRLNDWSNLKFASSFAALLRAGTVRSPYEPAGSTSLEGVVAPGVYLLTPTLTPEQLLRQMVDRFSAMARSAGLTPSTTFRGQSAYQLITFSSVVEKEGYYVKNMPQVATVIYNRLAKGTPLQMDATVLYSLGQDGGKVTAATLKINTPYNTYLHGGLPPTPICVVSKDALTATLNPPAGSWLFFTLVSKDGTMAFSDTFEQQLANERLAASRGL